MAEIKQYPIDEKKEPLLAALEKAKLLDEKDLEFFRYFDPQKKDHVIWLVDFEAKEKIFEKEGKKYIATKKVSGQEIRDINALYFALVFKEDNKLPKKLTPLVEDALKAHPLHKELNKKTIPELVKDREFLGLHEEKIKELQKKLPKATDEEKEKYRLEVLEYAISAQLVRDSLGSAKAYVYELDILEKKEKEEKKKGTDKKEPEPMNAEKELSDLGSMLKNSGLQNTASLSTTSIPLKKTGSAKLA